MHLHVHVSLRIRADMHLLLCIGVVVSVSCWRYSIESIDVNLAQAPENASLAEFLHAYPDNYMTRDLCGESTWKLPKWAINDFHRECATRRLDSVFSVVLVTEREEMWEPLLRKELGWTSFPNGDGSAKHERGDGPTSAEEEVASTPNAAQIIETIEAMHVHDMRVYEHALRMHSK